MTLGNLGVYRDILSGIGRYKSLQIEVDNDKRLYPIQEVAVEKDRVVLKVDTEKLHYIRQEEADE